MLTLLRQNAGKLTIIGLLLSNLVLLAIVAVLYSQFKTLYIDYRHFRSLPVGVSDASHYPASKSAPLLVLFGDSRIETWSPLPDLPDYRILNAGVTGESTSEMRRRFEQDVLRLAPDLVVIQAGINDLTAAATYGIFDPDAIVSGMQANMQYFLRQLQINNINTILLSILPTEKPSAIRRVFWSPALKSLVEQSNDRFKSLAGQTGAVWLDATALFKENNQPVSALYLDTLHINAQGYKTLNRLLTEQLTKN